MKIIQIQKMWNLMEVIIELVGSNQLEEKIRHFSKAIVIQEIGQIKILYPGLVRI